MKELSLLTRALKEAKIEIKEIDGNMVTIDSKGNKTILTDSMVTVVLFMENNNSFQYPMRAYTYAPYESWENVLKIFLKSNSNKTLLDNMVNIILESSNAYVDALEDAIEKMR